MSKAKKINSRSNVDLAKVSLIGGVIGAMSSFNESQAAGGGAAGSPSSRGFSSVSINNTSVSNFQSMTTGWSVQSTAKGFYASKADGSWMSYTSQAPSTPFLKVWNGSEYTHENDFLFGKPNTAFQTEVAGREAYAAGIGGDTYVLSDTLRVDEDGKLRMQIREIEPEQSFIDRFALYAVDLKSNEHLITDGNLSDSYVFNTDEARSLDQTLHHYIPTRGEMKVAQMGYHSLGELSSNQSTLLQANDELIIKVPISSAVANEDLYLLVDSYFRDWTLGNTVPLSFYDTARLRMVNIGRFAVAAIAGLIAYTGFHLAGARLHTGAPTAQADIPHYQDWPVYNAGSGAGTRSLVLTAEINDVTYYLQTIFPRFVRYTQEVVKVPKEIVDKAVGKILTLRIRATKKHAVRAAFAFAGQASVPQITRLDIESAIDSKNSSDISAQLSKKNGNFTHLKPGDTVELVISTGTALANDTQRKYVLKAEGFYTRLSTREEADYKKVVYPKLAASDQKLLQNLRMRT